MSTGQAKYPACCNQINMHTPRSRFGLSGTVPISSAIGVKVPPAQNTYKGREDLSFPNGCRALSGLWQMNVKTPAGGLSLQAIAGAKWKPPNA
jgi:hypothetical protein